MTQTKGFQVTAAGRTLFSFCLAAAAVLMLLVTSAGAWSFSDPSTNTPGELNEAKLLQVLTSDSPQADKALACKKLAICGTKNSVPALAALLPDEHLNSWARIALEVIPGGAADQALREAMSKLEGRLLVGVINSVGNRHDSEAVPALAGRLCDSDAQIAAAAATALGRIGNAKCAEALRKTLPGATPALRGAVAEACVACAERFLALNKKRDAIELYDMVRASQAPVQQVLEATRGAILARGSSGVPLLLETLRSPNREFFRVGLRTARELPGAEARKALTGELKKCPEERQPLLLLALADRNEPATLPTIVAAAEGGNQKTRVVAVSVLDRLGKASTIPVLLKIAAEDDPQLSEAATAALARLNAPRVEKDLLGRLARANGATRDALIEVSVRRGLAKALPMIVPLMRQNDASTRRAAIQAVGALGAKQNIQDLVAIAPTVRDAKEREDLEASLVAISSREGAPSVPTLIPLARNGDRDVRIMALHALAAVGGKEALGVVTSTVKSPDEKLQDEAVRTLSTWPNNWPEDEAVAEPLLELVRNGAKSSHQILGLRGYLQYMQETKKLKPGEKTAKLNELVRFANRPEEKRLLIGAAEKLQTAGSFKFLTRLVSDSTVSEDASSAIVKLAEGKSAEQLKSARETALKTVLEKSAKGETKEKATKLLNEGKTAKNDKSK